MALAISRMSPLQAIRSVGHHATRQQMVLIVHVAAMMMSVLPPATVSVLMATFIEALAQTRAGTPKRAPKNAETVSTQSPWHICSVDAELIA